MSEVIGYSVQKHAPALGSVEQIQYVALEDQGHAGEISSEVTTAILTAEKLAQGPIMSGASLPWKFF